MYGLFVTIIVIASVLLTIAVLLQNSKGGGLASNFAAGNQTFGVRQAADILEKATWWFAAIIIVFSIAATAAISTSNKRKMDITKDLQQSAPTNATPAFPITTGGQTEAPAEETPAQQ
ncbi:MAG: preprotein translocase subunit SecG [Bacteroidales bacterium]|nr:preprotein translocase subunit SecG [Bacteroidales bacterium]MBP5518436.1 preprotein translocase subunit SecG [Bacteroidales bacterium]